MTLSAELERIDDRHSLAEFVLALRENLLSDPSTWENSDLQSFLEAMAAWLRDMDGYYRNQGLAFDEKPTWRTIAHLLLAARVYE